MLIIVWLGVWLFIWTIFNVRYNWNTAKTRRDKYFTTSFFFLFASVILYIVFKDIIFGSIYYLLVALTLAILIGAFFSNFHPFYKHIRNGKYFLIALCFDILLQQIMVVVGVKMLSQYFGSSYNDVYFGLLFSAAHLPVLLCKWAKLRYLYIILTLIGGTAFSHLIINYSGNGVILSFMFHYILYVPIFYYLRDERKI